MDTGNLMLEGKLEMNWHSIHGVGMRNTPSRFMLQKPELNAGLMGHIYLPVPWKPCIFFQGSLRLQSNCIRKDNFFT